MRPSVPTFPVPGGEDGGRRFGYARVSTPDQSVTMQREALLSAGCERVFADEGVSGADRRRPGLDAMLGVLRPGDTVVVLRLDRLGRSVQHLTTLIEGFRADGVQFASLTEGIDTATLGGRLVFHIFSAIAEFQRGIIVENTLIGLESARRRGRRPGRPPLLSLEQAREARRVLVSGGAGPEAVAGALGVSPATLRRALRRFGLDGGDAPDGPDEFTACAASPTHPQARSIPP